MSRTVPKLIARLSAVALAGLLALPAGAVTITSFLAQNRFTVQPLDSVRFQVLPRGQLGVSDAWCAAGDYVIRGLGLSGNTPIWRISNVPRRSGQSMTFSLSSSGAAGSTGLMQLGGTGDGSMSAVAAQQLCWAVGNQRRRP